jgi:glycosyltransferase involved in cell wall biosynthesis
MSSKDISFVLPLYKPNPTWHHRFLENVEKTRAIFPSSVDIEFVIVNDGFETPELLNLFEVISETDPSISFISYAENMGKGYALRTGVENASAPYVVLTDFDFPYRHEDLLTMYNDLQKGYEVVTGKRNHTYYKKLPMKRWLISKGCSWLNRTFLSLYINDTQSGIKAFNEAGKKAFLATTINRFLIDTEFLQLVTYRNLRFKVNEVSLRDDVEFSNMGYAVLKTELKNFVQLVKQRRRFDREKNIPVMTQTEQLSDIIALESFE